jgi:hypothetical protein
MKYKKYNKVLESFDNINTVQPTQSSLSTYFQNNVDKDIVYKNNIYNNPTIDNVIKNTGWTGIWRSTYDPNFNAAFVQNNDKLLISFSNSSLNNVFLNMSNSGSTNNNTQNSQPNLFMGVAQLNVTRNMFNLTKIISNTYVNNSLDLTVNGLSGTLSVNKKNIELFSNIKNTTIILYKYYEYNSKENTIINGNDLKNGTIQNQTLNQCKTLCNANNDCSGFSFQKSTNNCYLKNNIMKQNVNNDYTSYIKEKSLNNNLPNNDNYINSVSPFVNDYTQIPQSEFLYEENYCTGNTKPCTDKNNGISLTTYNGIQYNACGTPTSSTDNTCIGNPTCFITNKSVNGIPICNKNVQLTDYMNNIPFSQISQKTGSTLNICDTINYIKKCNSFIICYVTNIGNVSTLNYQFFGSLPEESSLTLQTDFMNELLNSKNNKIGVLPLYRNIIQNSITFNSDNKLNALSFTNCFENNKESKIDNRISSSIQCASNYVNNYKKINGNNNLKPALWEINSNIKSNVINSCSIRLSTSSKYNTPVKYVKYNNDGSTSLSLFSSGNNEELIMENATVIQNVNYSNTSYVAITTNLRANNQLYLMPSSSNSGFSNNSNLVSLTESPLENGKWLLIGFSIDNISQLSNTLKNIRFNIINNPKL